MIDAIKRGAGSDQDRAIVMLHFELGLNPDAAARVWNSGLLMYAADIVEPGGTPRSEVAYHLAIPRVKKRTEKRQTRTRPLSPELGALLRRLQHGAPEGRLLHWLSDEQPVDSIQYAMNRCVRAAGVISPRTNKLLHLRPRRLRYTLATEMAREGASRHRIADVLDHTDLQNVEVYIEASSYIVMQVGDRFDPRFQPVLQRFLGKVVDASDPQPFGGQKRQVILGVAVQLPTLPVNLGSIGACGRDAEAEGICQLAPPLSCYSCDKFAAFRDFDHASIADSLEHAIATRFDGQADQRIPLQLVGTLHAIRQLQQQIADESPRAAAIP
ncbi:MAG: site-specific integrase [Chloroflexi bacterium]|nr:site-specific integrase [Chloroflexota bacterium]